MMNDQEKSSDEETEDLEDGSRDLEPTPLPAIKKEDPAEPRFVDWPKD